MEQVSGSHGVSRTSIRRGRVIVRSFQINFSFSFFWITSRLYPRIPASKSWIGESVSGPLFEIIKGQCFHFEVKPQFFFHKINFQCCSWVSVRKFFGHQKLFVSFSDALYKSCIQVAEPSFKFVVPLCNKKICDRIDWGTWMLIQERNYFFPNKYDSD